MSKLNFFKNQKQIEICNQEWNETAVYFQPLSGAAAAVKHPGSLRSVSSEQLIALHTQIYDVFEHIFPPYCTVASSRVS